MILLEKKNTVETNLGKDRSVSIQSSGKMVGIVTANLYSDPIKASVREVYSNAYDGHVMVGKQGVPFHVTFPTFANPTIRIRDFGPSMSKDFMENKYTLLGHSTKEQSEDQLGTWGLGRFSCLGYVDSYTVTTYHDGMMRVWSVHRKADQNIGIHLMHESPSSEPTGTEVSWAVQSRDLTAYQSAIREISKGFDPTPQCNQESFEILPFDKHLEGNGWFTYQKQDSMRGLYVKMGAVLYRVDIYKLDKEYYVYDHFDLVLDVPIGSVEVTPSREDLSFADGQPTKDTIQKSLDIVTEEMLKVAYKSVRNAPSFFEAWKIYNTTDLPTFEAKKEFKKNARWQGEGPGTFWLGFGGINWGFHHQNDLDKKNLRFCVGGATLATDCSRIYVEKTFSDPQESRHTNAGRKIKEHNKEGETFLWVKYNRQEDWKEVVTFLSQFPWPVYSVGELSDIPASSKKAFRSNKPVSLYKINPNSIKREYTVTPDEFDEGGYYVRMYSRNLQTPDGYIKAAYAFKNVDKLIGVPKAHWKTFKDASQWIELTEQTFSYEKYKNFVDKKEIFSINNHHLRLINHTAIKAYIQKEKEYRAAEMDGFSKENLRSVLYNCFGFQPGEEVDHWKNLKEKYPLLELEYSWRLQDHAKAIEHYMNLIDKENNDD